MKKQKRKKMYFLVDKSLFSFAIKWMWIKFEWKMQHIEKRKKHYSNEYKRRENLENYEAKEGRNYVHK